MVTGKTKREQAKEINHIPTEQLINQKERKVLSASLEAPVPLTETHQQITGCYTVT